LKSYECTIILSPVISDIEVKTLTKKYGKVIVTEGGEITKVEEWGKRRLAYMINDFEEGYYVLVSHRSDNKGLDELNRQLRLDENVLRHMIVRDQLASGTEPKIGIEEVQKGDEVTKEEY
jgi:small subunit ribosomal protein S6